jgi:phosphatidylglycerophosphate synthase
MNITSHRNRLKGLYAPLTRVLIGTRLTPNMVTSAALVCGILAAHFYLNSNYLLGAVFLFASGLLDLIDGDIAAKKNCCTKFGAVYDWIADKLVDGFVIGAIGIAYATPVIAVVAVTMSLVNTFIKPVTYSEIGYASRSEGKIDSPLESVGMFGRPETIMTILVFSVLHPANMLGRINLSVVPYIIALFTTISLCQRLWYLYKHYNVEDN